MTSRKLFFVIGGVIAAVILLVAIFVGAIVGLALYSIGKSEASLTAKTFLTNNDRLKQDIGNVTDFGSIITGSVNSRGSDGEATLSLKVIGEKRKVNANVSLMYRDNRSWRVTDASYLNESGQTVKLLDAYEKEPSPTVNENGK